MRQEAKKPDYMAYWTSLVEDQSPDRFKELDTAATPLEISRRRKAVSTIQGKNRKVRTIALLTSAKPCFDHSDVGTDSKGARKDLERTLRSGHYAWFPIEEKHGDFEKSYMVFNISREDAVRLGRKYGQESMVWIAGHPCELWESEDGKTYKPTQRHTLVQMLNHAEPEDDFRQISRAFRCRIPFFNGEKENMELYRGMVDHLSESLAKSNLSEVQMDQYIDEIVGGRVKGFNCWTRMGKLHQADYWW